METPYGPVGDERKLPLSGSIPLRDCRVIDTIALRRKLADYSRLGPWRPLERLALIESVLDEVLPLAQAPKKIGPARELKELRNKKRSEPDDSLVKYQLHTAAETPRLPGAIKRKIKRAVVAQYQALDAEDQIDAVLNRLIVASSNASMESFARAAETYDEKRRDLHLRSATTGAQSVVNLVKVRECRRNLKQARFANLIEVKPGSGRK